MSIDADITLLISCDAECGWNVTKALSAYQPGIAVAVPSAATTQHCVSSSVTQHCAIAQASTPAANTDQQSHKDAAVIQPVMQKLTEQGRLIASVEDLYSVTIGVVRV